jgi:hypothetical protein
MVALPSRSRHGAAGHIRTETLPLQYAVGRVETCPEARCPFWEPGGAVLEGRCAFDQLDFANVPRLSAYLLRIRKLLEVAGADEQEGAVRRVFHRLLNERGTS